MRDTLVDTFRQPEYTGENRCTPCTVLNVAIAGVIGAVVARRSRLAGLAAFGVATGVISLRGYLVPGTPELTKRYLPAPVLELFGKETEPEIHSGLDTADEPATTSAATPEATGSDGTDANESDGTVAPSANPSEDASPADAGVDTPFDPERYFLDVGVVEPCAEVDDLCLTDSFASAWDAEIDRTDTDDLGADDAAVALGFDVDDHEFEIGDYGDDARTLRRDGRLLGKWPSQAALVADTTAARVLESWDDDWAASDPASKGDLLNGLRLFLETCPTGGGEVVIGEETVESCCRSHDVIAVTCTETGERLFEYPVSELGIER